MKRLPDNSSIKTRVILCYTLMLSVAQEIEFKDLLVSN